MDYTKIRSLLEKQKQDMMMLDEDSGGARRERLGKDWSGKDETGKRVGLREQMYNNTIAWIGSELHPGGVLEKDFYIL